MREKLPINPNILKWARTSLGMEISIAAQKVGKSVEDLEEWESGESTPTYAQLETLAYEIYKRPMAVFFFPEVPKEDSPISEFRTLPQANIDQLPVEIIKLYRKAQLFQIYLEELFEGTKPLDKNLLDMFSLNQRSDIKDLAWEIREYLKISFEEQSSWTSRDEALKKWRKTLESKGIFIFKDSFRNNNFSGFCIYHEYYPIIYVNNAMPLSRQIYTLFHEMGHLLFHSGGVDFRETRMTANFSGKYSEYEIKCNLLASEVLVPSRIFKAIPHKVEEAYFESLADKFCVSKEVILRKYLDLNKIDQLYYQKMASKWIKEADKTHKGGGNYYRTQKAYLGESYINLAFTKFYQNKISLEKLSGYLNIKANNISAFEHYAFM
jgi:Zn-dependent peptidase ImmA (M78 family)